MKKIFLLFFFLSLFLCFTISFQLNLIIVFFFFKLCHPCCSSSNSSNRRNSIKITIKKRDRIVRSWIWHNYCILRTVNINVKLSCLLSFFSFFLSPYGNKLFRNRKMWNNFYIIPVSRHLIDICILKMGEGSY